MTIQLAMPALKTDGVPQQGDMTLSLRRYISVWDQSQTALTYVSIAVPDSGPRRQEAQLNNDVWIFGDSQWGPLMRSATYVMCR